jgi:hypothetical protein
MRIRVDAVAREMPRGRSRLCRCLGLLLVALGIYCVDLRGMT